MSPGVFAYEARGEQRKIMLVRVTYLISQDFRVDHIGCPVVFLICGQDDLDILAACCSGECHIELSVRKDRDPKVDPDTSDGLTLGARAGVPSRYTASTLQGNG